MHYVLFLALCGILTQFFRYQSMGTGLDILKILLLVINPTYMPTQSFQRIPALTDKNIFRASGHSCLSESGTNLYTPVIVSLVIGPTIDGSMASSTKW